MSRTMLLTTALAAWPLYATAQPAPPPPPRGAPPPSGVTAQQFQCVPPAVGLPIGGAVTFTTELLVPFTANTTPVGSGIGVPGQQQSFVLQPGLYRVDFALWSGPESGDTSTTDVEPAINGQLFVLPWTINSWT